MLFFQTAHIIFWIMVHYVKISHEAFWRLCFFFITKCNTSLKKKKWAHCLLLIVQSSCDLKKCFELQSFWKTTQTYVCSLLVTGVDNSVPQNVFSWKSLVQMCILSIFYVPLSEKSVLMMLFIFVGTNTNRNVWLL